MEQPFAPRALPGTRALEYEQWCLLAFAFVLPLWEAPKNILWVFYAALWVWNRARARDFGGRWDGWDSLIWLWIASGYIVAAFAGLHRYEWGSANDILRNGGLLWLLRRTHYPERTYLRLLGWLVASTLVGLAWGEYGVLVGTHHLPGLNSVGAINHSAIYLAIMFCAALVGTRAWWRSSGPAWRAGGLAILAVFVAGLFAMQSRAAVGAAFICAVVLLGTYAVRARHHLKAVMIGALVAVALVLAVQPRVLEKNEKDMREHNLMSFRTDIWRVGLIAWRKYPWFGVGMGNYQLITYPLLKKWSAEEGVPYHRSQLAPASHGHSLYVNALAERGVFGLGVLLALLAAWGVSLMRGLPRADTPPLEWTYWGGAAGAWLVAVIVGTVNTTLQHEHALVSMLLFGGWLALRAMHRPGGAAPPAGAG